MESLYLCNCACQACEAASAVYYCWCQCPASLCATCLSVHQAKYFSITHTLLPIPAKTDPGTYMQKAAALDRGIAALRGNLAKFAQCEEEMVTSVETAIASLVQYREKLTSQLRTEKNAMEEVVEAAVKEANEYLAGGPEPTCPLTKALWTLPIEQFAVVRFSVTSPDVNLFTQSLVSYHNDFALLLSSLSTPQSPVYIEPTRVKVFNSVDSRWDCCPLKAPVSVDVGTRYVWAGVELLCCGGSR